ncbi:MAG: type II toxin-antitoxin system HicB family antitoxin [bacterium]|nr:type II toxin-antitoxin system HicB family antitoxin [bacterium]
MEKRILNFRVIIEKENGAYNAHCPFLGLSDFGKTIDEALERITKLIKFHLESMAELGYEIPTEKETTTIVTSVEIPFSSSAKFALVPESPALSRRG